MINPNSDIRECQQGISGTVAGDGFHTPFLVATLRNTNSGLPTSK
jgi:hypothetical protein